MGDEKLFQYFVDETNKKFDRIEGKVDELGEKVDKLISFRILLIGAAVGISGIVSIAFQIITAIAATK